jgi:hypothetical protein
LRSGEVTIYGWHFGSRNALYVYYSVPGGRKSPALDEWHQYIDAGRLPWEVPRVMLQMARLWMWGALDERNRLYPEAEARKPKSCLPLNTEIDEAVLSPAERGDIDMFQPAGVVTGRRLGLKEMARLQAQGEAYRAKNDDLASDRPLNPLFDP